MSVEIDVGLITQLVISALLIATYIISRIIVSLLKKALDVRMIVSRKHQSFV